MKSRLAYQVGGSLLHRLHPLIKLAWLVLLTAAMFVIRTSALSLTILALLLPGFTLAGTQIRALRGLRILIITAMLLGILQIIFYQDGNAIFQLGSFRVTNDGLERGLYLGARFLAVILLSYLFVLTTSPNHLAYALMRAGLPYRFGFTFVTALRMAPIFEEEAMIVHRAQKVRGVSFRNKGLRGLWRYVQDFFLPLLVSAMTKVDALSISMEGRCYGMYPTRTYFKVRQRTRADWIAGIGLAVMIGLLALIKMTGG